MKLFLTAMLLLSVSVMTACGGRQAEPVMVTRPGDENKNCKVLIYDIQNIEYDIHELLPETDGKMVKNAALGVAGLYSFFIPWLLIDFSNAEAKEYEALRMRHDHLVEIAENENCGYIAENYPALDDVKQDYEKNKAAEGNAVKIETNN